MTSPERSTNSTNQNTFIDLDRTLNTAYIEDLSIREVRGSIEYSYQTLEAFTKAIEVETPALVMTQLSQGENLKFCASFIDLQSVVHRFESAIDEDSNVQRQLELRLADLKVPQVEGGIRISEETGNRHHFFMSSSESTRSDSRESWIAACRTRLVGAEVSISRIGAMTVMSATVGRDSYLTVLDGSSVAEIVPRLTAKRSLTIPS